MKSRSSYFLDALENVGLDDLKLKSHPTEFVKANFHLSAQFGFVEN